MKDTEQEIYRQVSEFAIWVRQQFPDSGYHISNNIEQLIQLSTQYHRICESYCNHGASEELDRRHDKIKHRVQEIFQQPDMYSGLELEFRGDPRGWPIKLKKDGDTRGIPVIH